MVEPGATFQSHHLYVIISDPTQHQGKCVLVNLTTQRPHSDATCVLQPHDFPSFVRQPSVVNYGDALLADLKDVQMIIDQGHVRPHPNVPPSVLERIIKGAWQSPFFPTGLRKYL